MRPVGISMEIPPQQKLPAGRPMGMSVSTGNAEQFQPSHNNSLPWAGSVCTGAAGVSAQWRARRPDVHLLCNSGARQLGKGEKRSHGGPAAAGICQGLPRSGAKGRQEQALQPRIRRPVAPKSENFPSQSTYSSHRTAGEAVINTESSSVPRRLE